MIKATAAGDTGLLLDTDLPPAWLAATIEQARLPGVVDVVPGAATVLVLIEPGALDWADLADLADLAARIAELPVTGPPASATSVVEIPVRYNGPDLADVARLAGLSVDEVIEAHAAGLYTVGWLGFCPGFGYLTGLDQRLNGVPRLDTPRSSVPAGSVAIAAGLAAVYPSASPGGWRLLGRTTLRMWDQDRDPAALLAPGKHVRFVPVPAGEAELSPGSTSPETARSEAGRSEAGRSEAGRSEAAILGAAALGTAASRPTTPCLEVIKPGPLATVQDLGRRGRGAIGVPPSGAADPVSLIAANRLVGNPDDDACVELTLGRATFRCHGDLSVAVTGAPTTVIMDAGPDSASVEFGARFEAIDGAVISVGAPRAGLRSYVAVAGGLAVPVVLGSRSSDLLSGLGGGPLRPGAVLPVGAEATPADAGEGPRTEVPRAEVPRTERPRTAVQPTERPRTAVQPTEGARTEVPRTEVPRTGTRVIERGEVAQLRVIAGPRLDWFAADALDRLCTGVYTVTPASNRTGLRLDGEPIRRWSEAELPSEGLVTGSLQVPPAGLPILHLADHPTVGGYPVIAVVASADIGQAAQLRPGDKLRFTTSPG